MKKFYFNPDEANEIRETDFEFREIIENQFNYWKWYLASIVFFLSLAFLYLKFTPNKYTVSALIFVDDEQSGGIKSEFSAFEDLGTGGHADISVINEIGLLKSKTLMQRVIKDLEYNIHYFVKDGVINREVYKDKFPLKINHFISDEDFEKLDTVIKISVISDKTFLLTSEDGDFESENTFGKNIKFKNGELNVTPSLTERIEIGQKFTIKILPVKSIAEYYSNDIYIQTNYEGSSLLFISLQDNIKKRGEDILNTLVKKYNDESVEEGLLLVGETDKFIEDRIMNVSKDLNNVDLRFEDFKRKNMLVDMNVAANLNISDRSEIERKIVDLNSKIKLTDYMLEYLENNPNELIPSNIGLENESAVNNSTSMYNSLMMERNRIISSSSSLNPTVINLDEQINTLKNGIIQSLKNLKTSLNFSLQEVVNQESKLSSKIYSAPAQEKTIRDIERQQQIVENLYLYLLQKREENALSISGTSKKAKIVDAAQASISPTSPKKLVVILATFLISLLLPFLIIFMKSILDNEIHNIEELNRIVNYPIIGDIPKSEYINNKRTELAFDNDSVSEAFRMVRSNLSFIFPPKSDDGQVYFIGSTKDGEGKSFVSINLARSLSLIGKNVLIVEADLRRPKLKSYLKIEPSIGLSEYLHLENIKISNIIKSTGFKNVHFIDSGEIPPNPSELLLNGKFENIIAYGKKNFDYVIVDTPPMSLVSDTLLLSRAADLMIYIVRANYLDKRLLLKQRNNGHLKNLSNVAFLLNSVNYKRSNYGQKYGYS